MAHAASNHSTLLHNRSCNGKELGLFQHHCSAGFPMHSMAAMPSMDNQDRNRSEGLVPSPTYKIAMSALVKIFRCGPWCGGWAWCWGGPRWKISQGGSRVGLMRCGPSKETFAATAKSYCGRTHRLRDGAPFRCGCSKVRYSVVTDASLIVSSSSGDNSE